MKERGVVIVFDKESADILPSAPGVYIFRGGEGHVLYVGKAKDLRRRVRSYFRSGRNASPRLRLLADQAKTMEYLVCSSERDALILEDTLIKQLRPRYNVRLRDDKTYPFIAIGGGSTFPRIMLSRRRTKNDAIYTGPYTSADMARKTLRFIADTFGLRTCSDNLMKRQNRPCLRAQLGHCLAPCVRGDEIREAYENAVRAATDVLMGRGAQVIKGLKHAMKGAVKRLEFEKAARLRDQIAAIQTLTSCQDTVFPGLQDMDAVGLAMDGDARGLALELAQKNADHALSHKIREVTDWKGLKRDFQAIFGKKADPSWIECVDISHTGGDKRVGALVCFKDGVPYKQGYRLFNLACACADDYAGIREVMERRARAMEKEGRGPTVIIVDGGRGQLNAALEAMANTTCCPFIMSIAKARRGKKIEKIYTQGAREPVFVNGDEAALVFIQRIRDEAHRFAISAHRKKMLKAVRTSILDEIPGIGKKRKEALLRRFGGLKGIKEASCKDLQSVPGISARMAGLIKEKVDKIDGADHLEINPSKDRLLFL